jgi:hypothetical protein
MDLTQLRKLYLEKKLTKAELDKREEIAQAIERENPGMGSTPEGMSKKMAIATAAAKKAMAKESVDQLDEISNYNVVVTYYRSLGLDPYKLKGKMGSILRAKIKNSPAFHAWAKLHQYEDVNSTFDVNDLNELLIDEKSDDCSQKKSKKGVEVQFFGYPDKNAKDTADRKDEVQRDNNYLSPN